MILLLYVNCIGLVIGIILTFMYRMENGFVASYCYISTVTYIGLLSEILIMIDMKSIKTYFKFWRIYDLLMYFILLLFVICTQMKFSSFDEIGKCMKSNVTGNSEKLNASI